MEHWCEEEKMDKESRRAFLEKLDKNSLIERLMVAEELLNEEKDVAQEWTGSGGILGKASSIIYNENSADYDKELAEKWTDLVNKIGVMSFGATYRINERISHYDK